MIRIHQSTSNSIKNSQRNLQELNMWATPKDAHPVIESNQQAKRSKTPQNTCPDPTPKPCPNDQST